MTGSKSDFLEDALLNHVLGGSDYVRPATVYLALFTARGTTAQADAGTNFIEVTGGSYARLAVTNDATNWPAASGGAKSNGTRLTFATPTASWGNIVAFGIYDDPSAGNLLYWGDMGAVRQIGTDAIPEFLLGSLVITED